MLVSLELALTVPVFDAFSLSIGPPKSWAAVRLLSVKPGFRSTNVDGLGLGLTWP